MPPTADPAHAAFESRLYEAGGDVAGAIAVLWTWLEQRMPELGGLAQKPPELRRLALLNPLNELTDTEREAACKEPIRGAALLLARLHDRLLQAPPLVEIRPSIDDSLVVVTWNAPSLAARLGGWPGTPPGAAENPSLHTLAPRLDVSPVEIKGVRLEVLQADSAEWSFAEALLERGLAHHPPQLEIHLNSLGDRGVVAPRLVPEEEPKPVRRCWFSSADDPATDEDASAAAMEAAAQASGECDSILLLPELALSDRGIRELQEWLGSSDQGGSPPALTVVGLQHTDAPKVSEGLATKVNEAVILGPSGVELLRHRKLSAAQTTVEIPDIGACTVVEDIQVGDHLQMVQTLVGTVAVLICLDSFAETLEARLTASPVSLMLVPSLSPTVHRHQNSLQLLVQRRAGVAFVCNRWFEPPTTGPTVWNEDVNRSFWAVQRKPLQTFEPAEPPGTSFIVAVADFD